MKILGKKWGIVLLCLVIVIASGIGFYYYQEVNKEIITTKYIASKQNVLNVLDVDGNEDALIRGSEVSASNKTEMFNENEYTKVYFDEATYYVLEDDLVDNKDDAVKETELWVYRTCSVYKNETGSELNGLIEKGTKIEITGHSEILEDGSVERYQFKDGYILKKYLSDDETYATSENDSDISKLMLANTEDSYGAGSASQLDYYENEKPVFEDNRMPEVCQTLYIAAGAVDYIESYIDIANQSNVNTFVIDIKDTNLITFESEVMKEYSPSSYGNALYTKERFKEQIDKCKEAGIYLIARMTVFKDVHYMEDHPEYAILDTRDGTPFRYGSALWPSAYCREVWEYNVELSKEVITDIGFNEIQYDYVRFPEEIDYYNDVLGMTNLQNTYNETRSQAVQRFLMYAADEVHEVGGYVSADVFGETCNDYVSAYGQYWPAISNVVDAISAMPYPDHFEDHAYGVSAYSWQVPYQIIYSWGTLAKQMQEKAPTPARTRTYIQGYDSTKEPTTIYDNQKIVDQVQGLIDSGIYDNGYIIWNAGSDVSKYYSYMDAFSRF